MLQVFGLSSVTVFLVESKSYLIGKENIKYPAEQASSFHVFEVSEDKREASAQREKVL